MYRVEKRLKSVDELVIRLNEMLKSLTYDTEIAKSRYEDCRDVLNKVTYHDAYRQVKSECAICQRHIDDVCELRSMIAKYGDMWQLRTLLFKHEKYVTSWERMRSRIKEGGTDSNG